MSQQTFMVMPTWNNTEMCCDAIRTLYEYTDFEKYGVLLLVDNSPTKDPNLKMYCERYGAIYYPSWENMGWMGSINYGFGVMKSMPYFTMCNDDVVFPQDPDFWPRTFKLLEDPKVAGVGPVSNYVMGWQQHRIPLTDELGEVELLVGFCATYKTSALEEVGVLDMSLPGGDDLDISIRMRKAGYKLICDRRSFLYHYGSATGTRIHSDWDNLQSQHRTLNAIIRKHGVIPWYRCVQGPWTTYKEKADA